MTDNPNCDGAGPHSFEGVRLYPIGAGGNLILCGKCWANENRYAASRVIEALPKWEQAKVYNQRRSEHD